MARSAAARAARSVRSSSVSEPSGETHANVSLRVAAPGRPVTAPARPSVSARPRLRLIEGGKTEPMDLKAGLTRVMRWARARTAPMLHVVLAAAFLMGTLLGALALRTQMVQNAFEASTIESNISQLRQDVADEQARLDGLEASLPQKATDLGMVPQSSSVTIDLNGYQETQSTPAPQTSSQGK